MSKASCWPRIRCCGGCSARAGGRGSCARSSPATAATPPYFRQIPDEFLQFLQDEWQPSPDYPPFLLALAHYEWIELMLSVSNRATECAYDAAADLLDGVPLLNPVLANLRYDWPVQRIAPRRKVLPAETFFTGISRHRRPGAVQPDQRVHRAPADAAGARHAQRPRRAGNHRR
jgi:Uncharacterized protein conserved in bacteria